MRTPAENMAVLLASPEYAAREAAYSNAYVHGAGRQRPGSVGFKLWLLYDNYRVANNNKPPSTSDAKRLAKEYGLNETSAENALGKWCAYNEFRAPRTGAGALGPRS